MELIASAAVVVGGAVLWICQVASKESAKTRWVDIARKLGGYELVESNKSYLGVAIRRKVDGFLARVEPIQEGTEGSSQVYTTYTVRMRAVGGDLVIEAEGLGKQVSKLFCGQDILTNDPVFDDAVYVRGQETEALARLGADSRQALRRMLASGGNLRLKEGYLLSRHTGLQKDASQIDGEVRRLVDLARCLSVAIPDGLARNATSDPIPSVRLRNLEVLLRDYPRSPQADTTARTAVDDPASGVRFIAARHLGPEGLAQIERIAKNDQTDSIRVQAMEHLAEHAPKLLQDMMVYSLASGNSLIVTTALRLLGSGCDADTLQAVVDLFARDDHTVVEAAARVLGRLGDEQVEPPLVNLLTHESLAVRTAAAESLGKVGTVRAVEPLLQAGRSARPVLDDTLKTAARTAARSIQARLTNAEAGHLSIAEVAATEGALSLAESGGELTIVEAPDSQ